MSKIDSPQRCEMANFRPVGVHTELGANFIMQFTKIRLTLLIYFFDYVNRKEKRSKQTSFFPSPSISSTLSLSTLLRLKNTNLN